LNCHHPRQKPIIFHEISRIEPRRLTDSNGPHFISVTSSSRRQANGIGLGSFGLGRDRLSACVT
jgi:hypothetical protein